MRIRQIPRLLLRSITRFLEDSCDSLAATISFWFMLSLVPLLIVILSCLALVLASSDVALASARALLVWVLPANQETAKRILNEIGSTGSVLGLSSIVILIWTGSSLFSSVESALGTIFRRTGRWHFIKARFLSLMMVLLLGLFVSACIVMSVTLSVLTVLFRHLSGPTGFLLTGLIPISDLSYLLMPFFATTAMLTLTYWVLIPERVSWSRVFCASTLVSMLWEAAKHGFTWYVRHLANFGRIHGSLSSIIVFMLWVFYSACLLLWGAELIAATSELVSREKGK